MKKKSSKYYVLSIMGVMLFLAYYISQTYAQTTCPTGTRATGLISSSQPVEGLGNPGGNCAVDESKISFAPFKIPTYDDLKSLYFTQSKAAKITNTSTSLGAVADSTVYNYTNTSSDITTSTYSYSGTSVIFIEGSIYINGNITGPADKGLVLVVKNNVNIDKSVTQVNAVIIAGGPIYTAGVGCTSSSIVTGQLVINGSLISLNTIDSVPIKFCRTLSDNSLPAEKVINQPKYLVILRNLLSDTYQKWSEI